MTHSQIIVEDFHSKSLQGNPLGDPATRRVPVYLPPNYDAEQSYPSLYLLSSFASRGLKLLNDDLWEEDIQQRLDRLILAGELRPMIVALPDASTRYGGSQYLNSPATGQYEDHILELVDFIDGKYPTLAERDQRAVMGHSSGGYGAIRFGMRHPDVFGLVASHSGDNYVELTYLPDFPHLLRYHDRVGLEGLTEMLADPAAALQKGAPFHALQTCAMAACFSPNADAPLGFDLPVDLETGELRPEIWARWQANDTVNMVSEHAEALRSLRLLFFDCGRYDEYNLLYGARIFAKRLRAAEIPFEYQEFEGGHRNIRHRYDISLQAISAALPVS